MTAFASNILAALPGVGAKIGAGQTDGVAGGQPGGFEAALAALLANVGATLDAAKGEGGEGGEGETVARPATVDQAEQPDAALLDLLLATAAAPTQSATVQAQPTGEGAQDAVAELASATAIAVPPEALVAEALPEKTPVAPVAESKAAAVPAGTDAPVIAAAPVATSEAKAAATTTAAPAAAQPDAPTGETPVVRADATAPSAPREAKTAETAPVREHAAAAQPTTAPQAEAVAVPVVDAVATAPAETAPPTAQAAAAPVLPEAARVLSQDGVTAAVARVVDPKATEPSTAKAEAAIAGAAPEAAPVETPVEVAAPVTAFAVAEAAAEAAQAPSAPVAQAVAAPVAAPAKAGAPATDTRRTSRGQESQVAESPFAAAPREKAAVETDAPIQQVAAIAPQADDTAPAPAPVMADDGLPEPLPAALETHALPDQLRVQADAAAVRGSPETVAKLAADITRKLEGQNTRFDLQLDPHGLGKVDVSIEINADGRLTAALTFDSAQAADALRGRQAELRQALQQAGFDVADNGLSFDLSGQGAGFGGRQADEQASAWSSRAFRTAQAGLDEADALKAAATTYSRTPTGGVDIRI